MENIDDEERRGEDRRGRGGGAGAGLEIFEMRCASWVDDATFLRVVDQQTARQTDHRTDSPAATFCVSSAPCFPLRVFVYDVCIGQEIDQKPLEIPNEANLTKRGSTVASYRRQGGFSCPKE